MKNIVLLVTIMLLISSCGDKRTSEEKIIEYNKLYIEAFGFYGNNNFEAAIEKLTIANEITDTIEKSFRLRAQCYFELGDFDNSIDDYTDAIELVGEASSAYKNRAIVNIAAEEEEDFIEDINNYLKFHKRDAEAYTLRGDYFLENKEYEDAIKNYTNALDVEPSDARLYLKRGNVYSLIGNDERSISDLEEFVQLSGDDGNSSVYFKKGCLYINTEQYAKALEDFSKIPVSDKLNNKVFVYKGICYSALGDYKNAIVNFSDHLSCNPKDYDVLKKRAEVYSMIGDTQKSYDDSQAAATIVWKNKGFFYKYKYFLFYLFVYIIVGLFIIVKNEYTFDNLQTKKVYSYFAWSFLFGGYLVALRSYRYILFSLVLFALLLYNNYEIVSYLPDIRLFFYSIEPTLINICMLILLVVMLLYDVLTIPYQVKLSNYKVQKGINNEDVIKRAEKIKNIKHSVAKLTPEFESLKLEQNELN
ncbi:tetratricopeptide repeat protein [Labilibaculum sp. DW002]|uniref:Tetratricopeptide repeat protein n=1 Tax=Paralabilibaculum antarcticum TaxID=2912572 RepID=A0ABT5VSS7_9BACT|nr:tetratricopeptide repeat protein [Labilibaculum sp. DW002]MDE5418480.1 tetratricopeptide repeat protein [Labilibaculum sp. DW002]